MTGAVVGGGLLQPASNIAASISIEEINIEGFMAWSSGLTIKLSDRA